MVGGANGLHLRIVGKAKSWIIRFTIKGKRCDIGSGTYRGVTLATAPKLANQHHDRIARGIDPVSRTSRQGRRCEVRKAEGHDVPRMCGSVYRRAQGRMGERQAKEAMASDAGNPCLSGVRIEAGRTSYNTARRGHSPHQFKRLKIARVLGAQFGQTAIRLRSIFSIAPAEVRD